MLPLETPPSVAPALPRAADFVSGDPGQAAAAAERARLVGLCAKLTGDWDTAEDLAQEALLVAHRHRHRLYGRAARWPWLAGIARNVCRHWRRSRGREGLRLATPR